MSHWIARQSNSIHRAKMLSLLEPSEESSLRWIWVFIFIIENKQKQTNKKNLLFSATGNLLGHTKLFTSKIAIILFPPVQKRSNRIVLSTATECIICDIDTLQPMHKLLDTSSIPSPAINLTIKDVRFLPTSATNSQTVQIFTLLNDDSIYVWAEDTSDSINDSEQQPPMGYQIKKQLHPIALRDQHTQNVKPREIQRGHLLNDPSESSRMTRFVDVIIRDYSKGLINRYIMRYAESLF